MHTKDPLFLAKLPMLHGVQRDCPGTLAGTAPAWHPPHETAPVAGETDPMGHDTHALYPLPLT